MKSADGVEISFERSGTGSTALVFVHGWLGSGRWWDAQRDAFSSKFSVVTIDLASHGASGRDRKAHSVAAYAADIVAVVKALDAERVVLIGHSMSGAHALHAALQLPKLSALVLVDTLKNVEQQLPAAQVNEMLGLYRRDFKAAVENVLPRFLFAAGTPPAVKQRLTREFLTRTGEEGAALLEPLYRHDIAADADRLKVPVRAINSDAQPTAIEANRRHFSDFDVKIIPGVGHYPMLEDPQAFNTALSEILRELKV
ncbi:MAG: alpha/beta hydrolase [Archangium sp.]|nr:alpha/beta hydrolase [Archangium sp.]